MSAENKKENKNEIKIGGRMIPLFYSTYEAIAIQEDIGCTVFELKDVVFGVKQDDEDEDNPVRFEVATDPVRQKKLGTLIRILGNAGLEEDGKEPDLTDKWVLRHMKPGFVLAYAFIVIAVIAEGNRIEAAGQEETGPVDEVLEEQNAKKPQGN